MAVEPERESEGWRCEGQRKEGKEKSAQGRGADALHAVPSPGPSAQHSPKRPELLGRVSTMCPRAQGLSERRVAQGPRASPWPHLALSRLQVSWKGRPGPGGNAPGPAEVTPPPGGRTPGLRERPFLEPSQRVRSAEPSSRHWPEPFCKNFLSARKEGSSKVSRENKLGAWD